MSTRNLSTQIQLDISKLSDMWLENGETALKARLMDESRKNGGGVASYDSVHCPYNTCCPMHCGCRVHWPC